MSCIAGQFHRHSAGAQRPLIDRMLAAMRERAPDGNQVLCEGHVGIGQAFLRTGSSGAECPNRLTLDGQVWITADARIDGRGDLLRHLRTAGREAPFDAPHAELILHAYYAFGDAFLDHLMGDFAFALWDGRRDRLVCVRDHFGVRPFYYAEKNGTFFFGSDIEALLAVPEVSRQLDEAAVADFLLLGMCTEAEQTIYSDIRCLAPATRMDVTRMGNSRGSYWELPRQAETRYSTRAQYVERFAELFKLAVEERLPDGPVALQLTGGMDSTSIAAVAVKRARVCGLPVTAYHIGARSIEPEDDEEWYARLVADHLGIAMVTQDLGEFPLFSRSDDPALRTAFPISYPQLALHHDTLTQVTSSGARVLLGGYSGDSVMSPLPSYYTDLLRGGRLAKFAREFGHHVHHARSIRGMGLRGLFRPLSAPHAWKPAMPDWIANDFNPPVELASRWARWWAMHEGAVDAASLLRLPWAHRQFEALEILRQPVVGRYPFQDLRLVNFLLGLPNFMLAGKAVLREAMHGSLPETVRARPKTSAKGDFVRTMVTNGRMNLAVTGPGSDVPAKVVPEKFMAAWQRFCAGDGADSTWASWLLLQPIAFGQWLSQQQEIPNE